MPTFIDFVSFGDPLSSDRLHGRILHQDQAVPVSQFSCDIRLPFSGNTKNAHPVKCRSSQSGGATTPKTPENLTKTAG
ncbi:hypothetical protein [Mesorhizobium sp. 1B3]|uniref:hypothetical protein n=1 Tax=Mesorhizobium sp. 1B3 TaxID=3243599 RepID=UPI003D99EC10